jgi:hypothetical protein
MGKNYNQLSLAERTMIQTQLEIGMKPSAIAKRGSSSPWELPPEALTEPDARLSPHPVLIFNLSEYLTNEAAARGFCA